MATGEQDQTAFQRSAEHMFRSSILVQHTIVLEVC